MATTTATITINSTDLLTDELSLSTTAALYNDPNFSTGLSRMKVTATSAGAGTTVLYTANDFSAIAYLYVKNTDATATDYIYVYADTAADDPVILKLAGGDWAYLPLNADVTFKAYATTNPTTVEFTVIGSDA